MKDSGFLVSRKLRDTGQIQDSMTTEMEILRNMILSMNWINSFLFAKNVDLSDTYATEFWEIFFNGLFTRTTELVSNILTGRGGIPMWKRQGKLLEILKTQRRPIRSWLKLSVMPKRYYKY